jgi:hypothetical protein
VPNLHNGTCLGKMDAFESATWPRQLIGAAIVSTSITAIGCLPYTYSFLGWLNMYFWLEVGLYSVSGIWFGAWGVFAAYAGSVLAWSMRTQYHSPVAFLGSMFFSCGAFFQALISAWAFRHFKGDPRIRTSEDAWLFVVFGIFFGGLAHTLTFIVLASFGMPYLLDLRALMSYWFFANALPALILGFPLLLLGSAIIIKAKAYCKGWAS